MGAKGTKLTQDDLRELQKATYFDKKELQKWYRDFMKDCPSGQLHQEGRFHCMIWTKTDILQEMKCYIL